MTCARWHATCDKQHVICDKRHVKCDLWYVTHDTWHLRYLFNFIWFFLDFCCYLHPLRDFVSNVCGIFVLIVFWIIYIFLFQILTDFLSSLMNWPCSSSDAVQRKDKQGFGAKVNSFQVLNYVAGSLITTISLWFKTKHLLICLFSLYIKVWVNTKILVPLDPYLFAIS